MIALRLLLVVALAFSANAGEDVKLAYELSDCLKEAIINGIPSIHLPSHNPLRINHNVSWNGDIGIASATFDLSNIVWYGIPTWNISLEQLSDDSDALAVFNYRLSWEKFNINMDFSLETSVVLIPGKVGGQMNITLDGNAWEGIVNFTKPGFNLTEEIEYVKLTWTFEAADFNFTGLGLFNEQISQTMASLFKSYFDSGSLKNLLGEVLQERLNTAWFGDHDRIDVVLNSCKGNSNISN